MARLLPLRALDSAGDPVSGATLHLSEAGTTTAVTIYFDANMTVPTVPESDADGIFPASYVPTGTYKLDMRDADGASLTGFPIDFVPVGVSSIATGTARPPAAETGTLWMDDSGDPFKVYLYNGSTDVLLAEITSAGVAKFALGAALAAIEGLTPAANKVPYFTGATTADLLGLGTAIGDLAPLEDVDGSAGLPAVDGSQLTGLPFTEEFASAGQTMTNGGLITLAHGLSAEPKLIRAYVECTSSELGYDVGDKVDITALVQRGTGATVSSGLAIYFDATNVYVRNGASPTLAYIVNKSTGGEGSISRSSWDLYVSAFA